MNNIIGCFYFRLTESGNLLGEFINNKSSNISIECATKNSDNLGFSGIYFANWIENNSTFSAKLSITPIPETRIFNLIWENENIEFEGEGHIVEGLLFGYYFSA